MSPPPISTIQVLGLPFVDLPVEDVIDRSLSQGGLLVAPSGPGLSDDFQKSPIYRESLLNADFILPDSGAMVLVWNLRTRLFGGKRLKRLSGLLYLHHLIARLKKEPRKPAAAGDPHCDSCWIMPSARELSANVAWLHAQGLTHITEDDCYIAPHYGAATPSAGASGSRPEAIEDPALVRFLEARHPRFVVVNIGGGVQEPLGWYLKRTLSFRPCIICTGAALAFFSGQQASIPLWADRFYLGWLMRIIRSPTRFAPRYLRAIKLLLRVAYRGATLPPL